MGFEQRIHARRFQALLESIDQAIAIGDRGAALEALEEARELRPAAEEVRAAAERVASLPLPDQAAAPPGYVWSRVFGAVALLLVGVSLLIGLDWLRTAPMPPPPPHPSVSMPALEPLNIPAPDVVSVKPDRRAAARASTRPGVQPATASRPSAWRKVFKFLGVEIIPGPQARPRGRSST
jgi:hypothetical protein